MMLSSEDNAGSMAAAAAVGDSPMLTRNVLSCCKRKDEAFDRSWENNSRYSWARPRQSLGVLHLHDCRKLSSATHLVGIWPWLILVIRVLGIRRPLLRLLICLRRGRRAGSPAWSRLGGRLIHDGRRVRCLINYYLTQPRSKRYARATLSTCLSVFWFWFWCCTKAGRCGKWSGFRRQPRQICGGGVR